MKSPLTLRLWRIAAVSITVSLLVLLLAPKSRIPVTPATGLDTLAHLASYLLVGLSWHRAGLGPWRVVVYGLAMASGTEFGQELTKWGRSAESADLAANVVGLLLGLVFSLAGPGGVTSDSPGPSAGE